MKLFKWVLTILLCVLFSFSLNASQKYTGVWEEGNDKYYLWSGVSWKNFEGKWKELSKKGYRLVDIETYTVKNARKYSGVWRAGKDGHYLWAGVSWKNFETKLRINIRKIAE